MSLTSTVECTSVRPGCTLLTGLCWSIVASIFGTTLGLYPLFPTRYSHTSAAFTHYCIPHIMTATMVNTLAIMDRICGRIGGSIQHVILNSGQINLIYLYFFAIKENAIIILLNANR